LEYQDFKNHGGFMLHKISVYLFSVIMLASIIALISFGTLAVSAASLASPSKTSSSKNGSKAQSSPSQRKEYPIPAPEMTNPELEKKMLTLAVKSDKSYNQKNPEYFNEAPYKVIITSSDWELDRNDFGIIKGRYLETRVIEKSNGDLMDFKVGEYFTRKWFFYQDYIGGKFSDTLTVAWFFQSRIGPRRDYINQANALSAIKGDFSFIK
jgi:hypothetical protein